MKQLFTILTTILFVVFVAYGQTSSQSANSNDSSDNLPKAIGYINDFENIFTDRQEKILDSLVRVFEKQTTIEIAIVTLDSSVTNKEEFDDYTLRLANYWGVGKKDKDNGILIGISSSLRKIRIQNGYGIENILTNEETKQIIDNYFIPNFKTGDFFEGTMQGTVKLMEKLK